MGQSGPKVIKRITGSFSARSIAALLLAMLACSGYAQAASPITVNKQFGSNTINLGAQTSVTITLENGSTASVANVSAFTDDISTMGGVAAFAATPALATTCVGGNPSITGTSVIMTTGQIPIAPDPSTPGTCTITFNVVGAKIGSGGNQIVGTNVVTDLGSPNTITQTLVVNPVSITAAGSATQTIQAGGNGTMTFTITNPAAATALTNVAFPLALTGNGVLVFQVTGGTTTCGAGTVALPVAGVTGTVNVSGATIPAAGSCTVTLTVTSASVLTVNANLVSGTITDDQGATNSGAAGAASVQNKFVLGQPNISKSFTPTTLVPGTNTMLKINIQNVLTSQNYTNAVITDTLPASLTLVSAIQNANCVLGTITGAGTGTIIVGGGMTMLANSTCTITAVVAVPAAQAMGGVTNTIPPGNFTSDQVTGAAAAATASLTVTGPGGGFTQTKAFTPTSTAPGAPVKVTLTFTSISKAYTGETGTFTDPLPATPVNVSQLFYYTDATHVPAFSAGCGASGAVTATPDLKTVNGSGLDIPLNGTCVVTFWTEFTAPIQASRTATNTIAAAGVNFSGDNPTGAASANLAELPALSLSNYVASNSGVINQPLTVSATINDASGTTDGSLKATFPLNTGAGTNVILAPSPNFVFGPTCPSGLATYLTGAAGATTWSLGLGGAGAVPTYTPVAPFSTPCTITYNVIDNGGVVGSFGPGTPVLNSNLTGNTNQNQSATNQVSFATTHILINKKFTPNQIQAGATSVADITFTVAAISGFATTEADVVGSADSLPGGMVFAPIPSVAFSAGCQQAGQPAPTFSIAGQTITFSGMSLITIGTTPTNCDATFNVTSSTVGAPLNSIGATTVTSEAGISNPSGTSASLTVQAGVAVQKTFSQASFAIGGSDYMRLLLTNSASTSTLNGGTLIDPMPAQLALASTTPGPVQAGDPVSCGATITGPVGSSTFTLSNISITGVVGTVPGQCVEYVLIGAATGATAGPYTNTIPTGNLNIGGFTNKQPTSAPVTLTIPPNITLSKIFAPASISPGDTSVLTISIANTAAGAVPLTGIAFTDSLPTGISIAATPGGATTCGAGVVTAVAAGASVALSAGTIAAGATCTVSVNVTGTTVNNYTNTIAAGGLTTNEGAKNGAPATAPIAIANAPNVVLSKAFSPTTIAPTGVSTLTITIANTAAGADSLTGMNLTDNLPANITIAAPPTASTTCGAGVVTAVAGATSVALAGGAVAAAATCTITVNVTGTILGNYTNTIPAGGVTTTQGASNSGPVTAPIHIANAPNVNLSKAFAPATIAPTGISVLTITVANTGAGAVALSGMNLTDNLPTNISIAAAPNASTTCGAGLVTAVGGATAVALTGGSVAAAATCTITVSVTGTIVGNYTNTIPTGGLTSTQGASNPAPVHAPIHIANAPSVTLSKAFSPVSIVPTATSVLTITVANTNAGAIALTNVALTDTLPANITLAATPAGSTTCGAGVVTATAGGTTVGLTGGSVAAAATCSISVTVTGSVIGNYINTIPAGGVTSTQGASNPTPATGPIAITNAPSVTLSKAFVPTSIEPGGTSVLTITIANTAAGSVPLSGVKLTDTLPTTITLAAVPNAATTCTGGTVTAVAGAGSLSLASASMPAGSTCTITVTVTGMTAGNYVNTIPAGGVTSTQGGTNGGPATAPIAVTKAPNVALAKSFSPTQIDPGATSLLTITISNTAAGSLPLSGMDLTDTLPPNISIAKTPDAATTCTGGTVAIAPGGTTVVLQNGTIASGATCTITVNVTGTISGDYINTIPTGGLTTTQGASNPGPATAPITIGSPAGVILAKAFSPTTIDIGGVSKLTITIANTRKRAQDLTGMSLVDNLPNAINVAAPPQAATTCHGSVHVIAGNGRVTLTGGSIAAGATCTITVNVTGKIPGGYVNVIPKGGVHTHQGATNPGPAHAPITIAQPASVVLAKSFSPTSIDPNGISKLTISIANTRKGAQNLTGVSLVDTLPNAINIASPPKAATTCNGAVGAVAGNGRVTLTRGSITAGTTCTITVDVTGKIPGDYVNTIPAGGVHTHQGASNPGPAHAPITITAPKISVTKSSDPEGGTVQAGDVITYTIVIHNSGTGPQTNATIDDTLTNATLVPGSVRVDGKPAPDTVVTAQKSFGTIAPGATVRITYQGKVNENVQDGAPVANHVKVGGDQKCTDPGCFATSPPNQIGPPKISVSKLVDGKLNQLVVANQVVVYSMKVTNVGGSDADNAVLVDNVPAGVTPIAGSVTVGGNPASKATVAGQLVTVPLGKLLAGSVVDVAFKATIEPSESGPAVNVVTVTANGIKTIVSNPVTLTRVGTTIGVTKVASATAATVGDRIDYLITVTPPLGVPPLAPVTVVDVLPGYLFYAPGTARLDGQPFNPIVNGQTLTWTIPKLSKIDTIFYSTVVGPGVPPNSTLTNVVTVVGHGPPGTKPVTGTANAGVLVLGTSIGSCYPITGRVYLDVKNSGRFEEGDIGVPGVYVYLDDGEYIVTDGYGRYNFPCVRPGMHALRLDESTLPPGITIYDDRNIDSERSNRRLVHRVYDQTIIEDINFAVTGTPATPIVSPETKPVGSPPPPGFPPPK
jgi:uncharacterized repeat protein (TIGR01451 family)